MSMARNESCPLWAYCAFGPAVDRCARHFDFALSFEDAVLSAIPSSVLDALAISTLFSTSSAPRQVSGSILRAVKLFPIVALLGCTVALTALWALGSGTDQNKWLSLADSLMTILDFFALAAPSLLEHGKSAATSFVLGL
ncbi:hypothetical protein DCS_00924 [Drechmeria coniospora]|uniref:Uncharacterized protein n=1 Tax=Drechmeria coniospora TaxID=98403 RepID=A0A151GRS6_DRECN|nr:hypothetical protein DCS_00924 [Drechmeria coniospora]KYK59790.1 hypothetical protein DCS_00924 [Drechmeria coniospora]